MLQLCLQDATELVAKLRAFHHTAQSSPDKKQLAQYGLDLIDGRVVNNVEQGVLEPALSKTKMIQVCEGFRGVGVLAVGYCVASWHCMIWGKNTCTFLI